MFTTLAFAVPTIGQGSETRAGRAISVRVCGHVNASSCVTTFPRSPVRRPTANKWPPTVSAKRRQRRSGPVDGYSEEFHTAQPRPGSVFFGEIGGPMCWQMARYVRAFHLPATAAAAAAAAQNEIPVVLNVNFRLLLYRARKKYIVRNDTRRW